MSGFTSSLSSSSSSPSSTSKPVPLSIETAEQLAEIVPKTHELELRMLRFSYFCKNPNCGRQYTLYTNMGRWECRCHYGHVEAGRWSCCGDKVVDKTQGCIPCDHWPTSKPPLVAKHILQRALCDYLVGRGVVLNNKAMQFSDDGLETIISRCSPIPYIR
jgi:hypothetical protein